MKTIKENYIYNFYNFILQNKNTSLTSHHCTDSIDQNEGVCNTQYNDLMMQFRCD